VVDERHGARGAPPLSAALGTLLFTLCVPGTVVVLVPWLLTRWSLAPAFLGTAATRVLGVVVIALATPAFLTFTLRFVREGHGTPAPIAPTRRLVTGGLFRRVRNPGYIAVVSLVAGQALLLASRALLIYAALLALVFHVFVVLYEEPTLRRTYGAEYDEYCRRVPRWIPRLHPAEPHDVSAGGAGTSSGR
jgi:protein-S-isoprenylcysteine O-methyltransferase Ste14